MIPLTVNGLIDTEMNDLTAAETTMRGMMNLWDDHLEGPYGVRHGRQPVSDFPKRDKQGNRRSDTNLFEKAFPCLYPYGRGGIEADRPVQIGFKEHIKWSLRYFNRRFRKDAIFPFFTFGISQCCEALFSAQFQMKRQTFERESGIIATVTKEKLKLAHIEEEQKLPISDPAVRLLR